MKYKLIIFDLDGTLLNTLDNLADSLNTALARFSFPKTQFTGGTTFSRKRYAAAGRAERS